MPHNFASCPQGFAPFGTSCYKYNSALTTFSGATQACKALNPGATLAVINDVFEDAFTQSIIGCQSCSYWIGLQYQVGRLIFILLSQFKGY